jgi:hypothetical protein
LSYRDELNEYRREAALHRKKIFMAIKITVVVLTVAFLTMIGALIADFAASSHKGTGGGGGGGGDDRDTKAPVLTVNDGDVIYLFAGENAMWKSYVTVTDESGTGKITDIDNSDVKLDVPGIYSVTYTVADSAGNKKDYTFKVVVTKKEYSYAGLMDKIKLIVESSKFEADENSTTKKKVQAIYKYVNAVAFVNTSNTPNISRKNWETDWVEEAHRTLATKQGDCYSYYSLSKAFFEYFGIENVGIQRDNSNIPSKEGTHFWCAVNIGSETEAQWYYYDATRLKGKFNDNTNNGCLMTLAKIQSYQPNSDLGYDFYEFDPSKYPTVSTKTVS